MTKPHIVLVPGAAHTPACMVPLMEKLQALGYTTHCQQMASVGNPNPPSDLSEDIGVLRRTVEEAIGKGNDVIVAPHSWGGVVTGTGLKGLSKEEREAQGLKGGVVRIAFMASFVLPEGRTLMSTAHKSPSPTFVPDGPNATCTTPELFYNDLSDEEQKHWAAGLKSQGIASFTTPTTYAAWKHIPSSYLLCQDDLALPPAAQEGMVKAAEEAGAIMHVTRIKSGHSPFLSKVVETAEWIQRVAEETLV
ncbi:hypothetical protein COCVIDRAFT_41677 [Bipolaris victoriae FI3]|uniref:AB hydrolase-1 domain-containing protein n=2 Tax=Bipolaris TaxID=33194 RepID=W6YA61_COCC2|nr:uncharacterized protein COCCADRAFT_23861 [Bipolaris zeicola 26-R-13]XP_014552146.1 hypothetical protein COCVIDRAFT_41677 [Bipolaris victoriae FI3]EUC36262.1 hypothetical protein COCCADRAFT_23861 [Bipolaris zeicola 26-R-13]